MNKLWPLTKKMDARPEYFEIRKHTLFLNENFE